MIHDLDPEVDKPFKDIGGIITPGESSDKHQSIQDISISWEVQITLDEPGKSTENQRTHINLALRVAILYVDFTSLSTSRSYPRLSDYRSCSWRQEIPWTGVHPGAVP